MANRTKLTKKAQRDFLKKLAQTMNVTKAAEYIGMSRRYMYQVKDANPEFSADWDDAVAKATDAMIEEARRRGEKGVRKPVFYKGKEVAAIREYSDTLLMFLIRGQRPEYATERREITGKDGGPIEVRELTDEQLAKRLGMVLAKIEKLGIDIAFRGDGGPDKRGGAPGKAQENLLDVP